MGTLLAGVAGATEESNIRHNIIEILVSVLAVDLLIQVPHFLSIKDFANGNGGKVGGPIQAEGNKKKGFLI